MKMNVLVVFTVLVSVGLFWFVSRRKREEERETKRGRFQAIKLRVTGDVLREYETEITKILPRIETLQATLRALETEVERAQVAETEKKPDFDACEEEFAKQKTSWEADIASQNKQKIDRSNLCDFVKTGSEMVRTLCGEEAKPEEAKAEAPKPEEAKAEAPKPEEAKAEAPKPEEAKAEAPKPEEAKAEAPKPEEAKAEAPKPEEAKAEAPKPEEAKPEAPKPEEAKA
ncbi:hypothetical protein NHX12_002150 [Muraenolepis orangiensis]|uniref:Uncharacterized protein n=1 Tax=Muraenolepis orangiensis TaxID=630683 RepID=A0A9Q0IHX4_9TELE|nr:hypothetical protein NHX12_002150 [Muraenolepis orangiensis]